MDFKFDIFDVDVIGIWGVEAHLAIPEAVQKVDLLMKEVLASDVTFAEKGGDNIEAAEDVNHSVKDDGVKSAADGNSNAKLISHASGISDLKESVLRGGLTVDEVPGNLGRGEETNVEHGYRREQSTKQSVVAWNKMTKKLLFYFEMKHQRH